MKKILLLSLLGISFCLANECPDLSKKEKNDKFKEELMKKMPNINFLYKDILENYNNTVDTRKIEQYISEENLKQLSTTPIWGKLIDLSYKIQEETKKPQKIAEKEETINDKYFNGNKLSNLQKEYIDLLSKIKPENKNWCTEEGIK